MVALCKITVEFHAQIVTIGIVIELTFEKCQCFKSQRSIMANGERRFSFFTHFRLTLLPVLERKAQFQGMPWWGALIQTCFVVTSPIFQGVQASMSVSKLVWFSQDPNSSLREHFIARNPEFRNNVCVTSEDTSITLHDKSLGINHKCALDCEVLSFQPLS